jgi:hypothetical protein
MRKILCLLTFLAAISCEYEIEIRTDPDETGRILIQSLAGLAASLREISEGEAEKVTE